MPQRKYDGIVLPYKMASGETLTALRFVKLSTDTTIAAIAAATNLPIGVLLEKTARTDVNVPVQVTGVVDVEVGTAGCTRGTMVKIDAAGCVEDSTFATTEVCVGIALESKTDGEYAKVLLSAPIDVP
jgi:hypothetical protein